MIGALISLIVYLLIIGLLYWLIDYIIKTIPIPDPPARIIRIALMILLVLVIIVLILNLFGGVAGVNIPELKP